MGGVGWRTGVGCASWRLVLQCRTGSTDAGVTSVCRERLAKYIRWEVPVRMITGNAQGHIRTHSSPAAVARSAGVEVTAAGAAAGARAGARRAGG